jgi:hypothetical protein
MSSSKPSREVHVIDVPDVGNFAARFVYNYHVPDEGVEAGAGVTRNLLSKPGEYFDARVIDYLGSARAPRYVVLTWKPATYRDRVYGQSPYFQDDAIPRNYIRDNLQKLLSEEHFASDQFTSINVSDQSIDSKLHSFISSSATILNDERQNASSQRGLALQTNELTSNEVDYEFLSKYLVQPAEDNTFFYTKDSQRIRNEVVNKLKEFNVQVQLNNSVIHTLMKRAVSFPESTFDSVHLSMFEVSKKAQGRAQARGLRELQADDYRTVAPDYVRLQPLKTGDPGLATRARLVGYVINRHEILPNGEVVALEPIVVENPGAGTSVDLRVKYYARYQYTIRAVAEFSVPSIVEETNDLVVSKFLIASRPSAPQVVSCHELVAPPPPSDVRFTWDWDTDKLFISWAFPSNPQRDVKQFQVFRRASLDEPFELVKQIAFDDSVVPAPYAERPDPRLVETVTNPKLYWIDDEFTRDSAYIYALGTVDAHGMVSVYGPQSRVSYQKYKNRLKVERLSPAGAPRPYPNMYVSTDAFVDSVVESKKHTMKIAFTPEHERIVDKDGNDLNFIKTVQKGGSYKILAMNTDLAAASTVEVLVQDRRPAKVATRPSSAGAIPDYGDKVAKKAR